MYIYISLTKLPCCQTTRSSTPLWPLWITSVNAYRGSTTHRHPALSWKSAKTSRCTRPVLLSHPLCCCWDRLILISDGEVCYLFFLFEKTAGITILRERKFYHPLLHFTNRTSISSCVPWISDNKICSNFNIDQLPFPVVFYEFLTTSKNKICSNFNIDEAKNVFFLFLKKWNLVD